MAVAASVGDWIAGFQTSPFEHMLCPFG
ncbi:hypothetical protein CCACVL1_15345 [Corchorus capsularis]|uniref:Uncharacterized protein n=1 Tax=Corchorus capsularis TaxID=210143 RepID=A0A1R3I2R9_COCAP|nr:hypothetical protein CCACVL1_15345 [Corchorus capsularis]